MPLKWSSSMVEYKWPSLTSMSTLSLSREAWGTSASRKKNWGRAPLTHSRRDSKHCRPALVAPTPPLLRSPELLKGHPLRLHGLEALCHRAANVRVLIIAPEVLEHRGGGG